METKAQTMGVLLAFALVLLVAGGVVRFVIDVVRHGNDPIATPSPSACQDSVHVIGQDGAVRAECPPGTTLTMHSESRALCLCPRP